MAVSTKLLPFLFLIVLFSSTQILARESKFFSKFNHHEKTSIPTTTTTNQEQIPLVKQEEETNFTPQTTNGYGLYGHDLNESPSSTTENTQEYTYPSKTPTEEYTGGSYEVDKEVNAYNNENKNQFGVSDTRFMDNNNNKEQDTWYAENGNKEKYYNNDKFSNNNNQQQGLSDTRFMENGRYENLEDEEQTVDIPDTDNTNLIWGDYKVVVDGSFDFITGMAGAGAIIYDGEEIKAIGHIKFRGHDPLEAEAMAIKVGMKLAMKCRLSSVTICGDNQSLMQDLEAQNTEACWSCYGHYEDIFNLLKDFRFINFVWSSRSKVQEAHALANWARLGSDNSSFPVNFELDSFAF